MKKTHVIKKGRKMRPKKVVRYAKKGHRIGSK